MANSIVMFGANDAGKTTLAGYLYATTLKKAHREKLFEGNKMTLGAKYDEKEKYSYLISDRDEIKGASSAEGSEKTGNTKRLHFTLYSKEFVIIDTPGAKDAKHKTKQRDKGIFMGDIGIFVVDANELLALEETKFSQFSYVFLWNTLKKSGNKLIIALAKIDLLHPDDIMRVCEKANYIFNMRAELNAEIIPISVNRNSETLEDINITTDGARYNGKTIIECLRQFTDNASALEPENEADFCIYPEQRFDHTHKKGGGVGRTWRNKILYGTVKVNDKAKMLPIKYNSEYTIAQAKIKNIRMLDENDSPSAKIGEIVGLDLSNTRVNGKSVEKSEITTSTGTLLVGSDCKVHCGNLMRFRLAKKETDGYREFRLLENINVFWLGNTIETTIISKYENDSDRFIIVIVRNSFVAMPSINGMFLIKRMPLAYIEECDDEWKKYINADLDKVGEFDCAYIPCDSNDIDETFSALRRHQIGEDVELTLGDARIIAKTKSSNTIVEMIKNIDCAIEQEYLKDLDVRVKLKLRIE